MPLCKSCLVEIFCSWAAHEIQRVDSFEVDSLCKLLEHVMIVKQTFGLVSKGFNLQKPRATYTSQNGVFTERVR